MTPPTETSPAPGGSPPRGPAAALGPPPHRADRPRTTVEGQTIPNGRSPLTEHVDEIDLRDGRTAAGPGKDTIDLRDRPAPTPGDPFAAPPQPAPERPAPCGDETAPAPGERAEQEKDPVEPRRRAEVRAAVEAVLMVVDDPIEPLSLASALDVTVDRVEAALAELVADYDDTGRGFELRRVAGGWRIYSRREYSDVVERFLLDGQTAKLTQAALETLAIVAYRQPVSRSRVGAVRGVNVDAVMRTLTTRGLVEEAGHDPETGAVLYSTTQYFLQRIGLESIEQLPALAPYLPAADALEELAAGGPA
ncbi:MAG: segregation and condensation protein [Actinomycetota bacterium]|nr:segregation and condensation protein [Actinomycetota bacterium]